MKRVELGFENDTSDLKAFKEELYSKIVNSIYYNDFLKQGFTNEDIKNNLTKFSDYIDDAEIAKKIKTYKDCRLFNKFDRLMLVKEGNMVNKEYVALEPYFNYTNYINNYFIKDFNDDYIDAKYLEIKKEIRQSIKDSFVAGDWIYLYGAIRSGRTYAAIATVNKKFIGNNSQIAFLNSPKRCKELCDLYFKSRQDFDDLMKAYCEVDCLVFDDFGQELKSKLLRDNILYVILSKRASENKMTIFTSDFSPSQIFKLYSKLKDDTNDVMSSRFIELLKMKINNGQETSPLPIY
jgi:primosomal protein DnaI